MNPEIQQPQPAGLKLDDIYYVLFRHKWKILIFSGLGVVAAALMYFASAPVYQSEAKLLIRYILENRSSSPVDDKDQIKSPDSRGENIINSELEILSSLDLARQVVDLVGADKILAKAGGGSSRDIATAVVRNGLTVDVPRKSNIIRVLFTHPDPEVVQPVLERLIEVYRKKHIEIHRGIGIVDDFLSQQTDQLRARLSQTEAELRKVKTNAGVISLEASKTAYIEQITELRQAMFTAEAELEERKAAIKDVEKLNSPNTETNAPAIPTEKLAEYKDICTQLSMLTTNRTALLARFREDSPPVISLQDEIARIEGRKKKLEEQDPKLLESGISPAAMTLGTFDVSTNLARIRALEARANVLKSQLQNVRTEANELDRAESEIVRLQRQKELEETNFRFYSANLEQARADEAMGPGRVTNINTVQTPSPASADKSKVTKPAAMALAGGIGFGLGVAFLLELLLNQSIRRPTEIETKLNLPLFLSIPDFSPKRRLPVTRTLLSVTRRLPFVKKVLPPLAEGLSPSLPSPVPIPSGLPSVEDSSAPLSTLNHQPSTLYFDSLRDRLITWFEARKLAHRPKLVAITSCSKGAGVSTIATGLAASLSEVGGGSVLLVDMDHDKAAAHPFLNGKPACALHEAFEEQKPEDALAQQNLYVASGNGAIDNLPKAAPKRFSHLMPKIKASDYDFIIFDMPPVAQTSVTPRLVGHMDLVLMVIEAEKTSREAVKRGIVNLRESSANVVALMNRTRLYVPRWLHHNDA